MNKWDDHFLKMAELVSTMSKDPSTKCGAVVVREYPGRAPKVVSTGYNGFPPGCDDSDEIYENREEKYARVVHAECNAILNAEQSVRDCTMYTFPGGVGPSCDNCTKHIIAAGIAVVKHLYVAPTPGDFNDRWAESITRGLKMYEEAGVEVVKLVLPSPELDDKLTDSFSLSLDRDPSEREAVERWGTTPLKQGLVQVDNEPTLIGNGEGG